MKEKEEEYHGYNRCFGEYQCSDCNRWWKSANSWRGFAQECNNCGNGVHAHKQTRLQPREFDLRDFDVFNYDFDYYCDKSHPQSLCGKCKRIGHYCGNS